MVFKSSADRSKMTIKHSSAFESISKAPQESIFFASFPGFDHRPDNPVSKEFGRLAKWRGWKNGSKNWRKNWNSCMAEQYDLLIGDRINDLATWQQMCRKLDIPGEFPSINKCRQVGPHYACHVPPIKLTRCFAYLGTVACLCEPRGSARMLGGRAFTYALQKRQTIIELHQEPEQILRPADCQARQGVAHLAEEDRLRSLVLTLFPRFLSCAKTLIRSVPLVGVSLWEFMV